MTLQTLSNKENKLSEIWLAAGVACYPYTRDGVNGCWTVGWENSLSSKVSREGFAEDRKVKYGAWAFDG